MLINCTSNFSTRRTNVEKNAAHKMLRTVTSQLFVREAVGSVFSCFWKAAVLSGIRVMIGMNEAKLVSAPPNKLRGISRDLRTRAYLRTPGLTMPTRKVKSHGRNLATSLETHKLSQTISIHVKNQTILTPAISAPCAAVAPMMIGMAKIKARGRT